MGSIWMGGLLPNHNICKTIKFLQITADDVDVDDVDDIDHGVDDIDGDNDDVNDLTAD